MKLIIILKKLQPKLLLVFILLLALLFRLYGISWDSGFHFHPDERMLIMVAERITFWSQLNPDFFNYGSLPVYLLAGLSQLIDGILGTSLATYDGMLMVGRIMSTLADFGVVFLIFHISYSIFNNKTVAMWSSFFYAVAFFPIQNSHFFIVDTFLNLFSTLLIYQLILFHKEPNLRKVIFIGITFAAAITSKISAIIFLPVIFLALITPYSNHENLFQKIIHFFQRKLTTHNQQPTTITYISNILKRFIIFTLIAMVFAFLFMPYAFIESGRFLNDTLQQIKMNSDAYIFPYTLQYVGTLPYWYYVKNIFLWGLGPVISIFSIIGLVCSIWYVVRGIFFKKRSKDSIIHTLCNILHTKYFLFSLFYLLYFLIIGRSAVKFMRYMLLMYPLFAIFAGYGAVAILNLSARQIGGFRNLPGLNWFSLGRRFPNAFGMIEIIIISISLLWTLTFLNIYSTPNTRIQATKWINQFIPNGSILGVEHWDDRVPIFDSDNYQYEELTLYELPDDQNKLVQHYRSLQRLDYIILASNRLYTPLQKLHDCEKYEKCYPLTARYYQDLFDGKLGFVKIAEFTSYPRFQIMNFKLQIIDDDADESFTVYDHPKIMIFKKI